MITTNADRLVEIGVVGEISPPRMGKTPYRVSPDGEPLILPGTGGITYNVRVGDRALGWAADHVEPGVSIQNAERQGPQNANAGLNVLACVGNKAVVVSGDAKGGEGVVTGKHGGVEHVLVDFPGAVLEKLVIGDRILIRARGLGLAVTECPNVKMFNLDPDLLAKLKIRIRKRKLVVPVAAELPASTMGSGVGASHVASGDYDMQLADEDTITALQLHGLRLGDIVSIKGADHRFGRTVRSGAIAVGIVVHTDCVVSGHGPGVTTLMASMDEHLETVPSESANIAEYLRIGSARGTDRPRRHGRGVRQGR